MRKIINICVFTIAGVAAILILWFAFPFNQDAKDKFDTIVEIKKNHPQMISDLVNTTVETLPTFVSKYEIELSTRNEALINHKIQRDIFYTFIFHLKDITNEETFNNFKTGFKKYSKSMFALSNDKEYFINGFNSIHSFSEFQSYYKKLNLDYEAVRQNYLKAANLLKAEKNLLKQVSDIHSSISITKKQFDLNELQKDIRSYKIGSLQFNITLNLFYILFVIAIIAVIVFLLWNIFVNLKSSIGLLAGISILALLVIIGYWVSSSELSPVAMKLQETPTTVKWVGAGLFTFYCVFFGTIITIIFTLIYTTIKKAK